MFYSGLADSYVARTCQWDCSGIQYKGACFLRDRERGSVTGASCLFIQRAHTYSKFFEEVHMSRRGIDIVMSAAFIGMVLIIVGAVSLWPH